VTAAGFAQPMAAKPGVTVVICQLVGVTDQT
jgi:hypothetical protein